MPCKEHSVGPGILQMPELLIPVSCCTAESLSTIDIVMSPANQDDNEQQTAVQVHASRYVVVREHYRIINHDL